VESHSVKLRISFTHGYNLTDNHPFPATSESSAESATRHQVFEVGLGIFFTICSRVLCFSARLGVVPHRHRPSTSAVPGQTQGILQKFIPFSAHTTRGFADERATYVTSPISNAFITPAHVDCQSPWLDEVDRPSLVLLFPENWNSGRRGLYCLTLLVEHPGL